MTQLRTVRNLQLKQHGGLINSAYHLVHPEGATLDGQDQCYNISTVAANNFVDLSVITDAQNDLRNADPDKAFSSGANVSEGLREAMRGAPAANAPALAPRILDYRVPNQPQTLVDAGGRQINLRGDTVYTCDYCCTGIGVANLKCIIAPEGEEPPVGEPVAEDTEAIDYSGCCPPMLDCPECEPCEGAAPFPTSPNKEPNICSTYSATCIPIIYSGMHMSTFQLIANGDNPWDIAKYQFMKSRSCSVEHSLLNGSGQVGHNGQPTYGCLGGANVNNPNSVGVIHGGHAMTACAAIAAIDEALGACLCDEIGMIHIPASLAYLCCEYLYHDVLDYGDGMGPRKVLRTKSRGNIVVVGGGYTGAMGPDGCPCEPGAGWIYGTSMVNLVYGHAVYVPDKGEVDFSSGRIRLPGSAMGVTTNDMLVMVEQPFVPLVDKCCRFAAKATLCT